MDDQFLWNRKSRAVGVEGRMLFVTSLCFCAQQMNDGRFPSREVPMLAAVAEVDPVVADKLVEHDLWLAQGDEIVVKGYLKFNPSREQAIALSERGRKAAEARHGATSNATSTAESNAVPSRPPGSPSQSSSACTNSEPAESDDDDEPVDIPEGTWQQYAERKLSLTNGIENPGSWKRKVAKNAAKERRADAVKLLADFEATAVELATALLAKERGEPWRLTRRTPTPESEAQ